MSESFVLSCCTTVDLTSDRLEERNIPYIYFHYEMDGVQYEDDMGKTMSPQELFEKMAAGADTKTSQVTMGEYMDHFEKYLRDGKDVLHLTLSTGISGTYNSACAARDELAEKYPDRKLYVVDSLAASSGFGLLVEELADRRDAGISIDDAYKWVEENKLNVNHWFFTSDLTFFIRGGRVSKAAGTIATFLGICPLLNVDFKGRLIPRENVRSKKKVIKRVVEVMKERAKDGLDYSGRVYISNSACEDDARAVADLIEKTFPKLEKPVEIYSIGTTIGSHTGPGTVALFFVGEKRVD